MARPRVSVLLPTHNRADVLGLAIASVLSQSEPDFELLIVADGCTDGTREVVTGFSDRRIRLFDLPKAPHFGYANRNIALREARGELVAYAAHDDLMLPDHLQLLADLLRRTRLDWGYSRPLWVSSDGVIVPFCTNLALADELQHFLGGGNTIPSCCVVHSRVALERAGYWPQDLPSGADWALWRRMIGASPGSIAYQREPTSLHFSADWKRSRFSGMTEVKTLLAIASGAPWWPAILRHPPAGEPEQAAIWRAIEAGGAAWVAELRQATGTVVDRLAWTAVRDLLPGLDQATADLASTRAEVDAARAEVAAMRASASWRVTRPLRGLVARLRAWGSRLVRWCKRLIAATNGG